MTEHIVVEREDGLLTLRLDRLDKLNALTNAMYSRMAEVLLEADQDASVRVVLLTGSTECFTAGNDLEDFLQNPPQGQDAPVFRFMRALFELRKPVIAAVAGPAIGIGTTVLLHCDLIYVTRDTVFKMPFVNLGLSPEFGSSLILPALVGKAKAAELLLLGEGFKGEQAAAWGIANAALEDGAAVLAKAREAAQRLLRLPTPAVRDCKRLLTSHGREELRQAIADEAELFSQRLLTPEAIEALNAFMEKRKPDFSRFV
jgi:enoyl-CoA hydratase/carnithine racemase